MRSDATGGVRRAPVVVGRETELDHLSRMVRTAPTSTGSCAFLVGEAGVGKTRLLAELSALSRQLGLAVMAGRSPVTSAVPFSVIAEALRSWLRSNEPISIPAPFDAGVRLVIPEWTSAPPATGLSDAQLRLLALEGVVRLVQAIAASTGGAAILLDDLHAADPESLETMRYLASARIEHVVILGALRSGEATLPDEVVRSLARDGTADILELAPLDRRAVGELIAALLDAEPPAPLLDDVIARTDGVPFLVEEVVDTHLRSGSVEVAAGGAHWRGGTLRVPKSVRDMVDSRLDRLAGTQRVVVRSGAVLGEFDVQLLASMTSEPLDVIGEAVTEAINAGVLETVGGSVAFRHALIREAVLEAALPHEVRALHARAAEALAVPAADDASNLERRAQHLARIDEHDQASELLVAAATRLLRDHALLGAELLARRAVDLARASAEREAATDMLAHVLATQGRWTEALILDEAANRAVGDQSARRLRMAACAVETAQPDIAEAIVARAIEEGEDTPQVHVLAGRVAMAAGRANDALASADRALATADELHDVEARCTALDIRGRAFDYLGRRDDARIAWTRQADEAAAAGLTGAHMRAVVQLGKLEVFSGTAPDRLYEAVNLAREAGGLVEQAWAEENLAIALAIQGDPAAAIKILDEAIPRCRELRLDQLSYLLAARGGVESMRDFTAVGAFLDEAEQLSSTADLRIHTYGIRADVAMRAGRFDDAVDWAERCVELIRQAPGGMPSDVPCWLIWAYAAAGRPGDAARALVAVRELPDDLARWHARPVTLAAAEAMLNGDEAGVEAAFSLATSRMPLELALMRALSATVIAGPMRGRWLREALDIYESAHCDADSARLRRLIREAGGPVPRRRRSAGHVPDALAPYGVTPREAELLRLLGDGLSNAVIADQLYLSVRTVETHVSSLLAKLQVESRGQLTAFSATVVYDSHSAE